MNTPARVVFGLLFVASLAWPGESPAQTFTVAKFSLGGDGGTDYLTAEPGTGRVFVSRGTHVMVVDGATGLVVGDIPDTPRAHGIALAPRPRGGHGFIINGGDSTVTMFDLKTLAVIKWFFAINHARTAPAQTSRHTLVAVFAHPDDERIVGPILARYAREGHDVYLVIATDGRKGVREHAGIPAGDSLAQVRAGEARCAARELGIHPPTLLGFEDAGLASFESLEGLRTKVDSILRALQPDAVISFGPEGGTGHPDHRLVGDVVTEVIQTGGPGIPGALYYPSLPAELMKDAPPARPTVTAVPERYLSVAVPFTPADLEAGRREFACHRTQYTPTEMDAINRYLAHGWSGAVRLRPWNGGGERRTSVFDR
jgi:LmbE family N-acetylglucosaminyl deacetylase